MSHSKQDTSDPSPTALDIGTFKELLEILGRMALKVGQRTQRESGTEQGSFPSKPESWRNGHGVTL